MYEMSDDSWLGQRKYMAPEMVRMVARRISEHVDAHQLAEVQVILHGGEPLLAGSSRIAMIASELRQTIKARVDLRVQTNGTRLTDELIGVLAEHRIQVGVSLDGGREENDHHRRFASGNGSFDIVARSVGRLRGRAPQLFTGILCTVDLRHSPVETYKALCEFEPPAIDFLLPHGNWTNPPPGRNPEAGDAPYGEWLAAVFDVWYGSPRPRPEVRTFRELMSLMLGGRSEVETVGLSPVCLIVVNTDGELEQVDTLRSAFNGAVETGLNVRSDSFDAALDHPAIIARQLGVAGLPPDCRSCALHPVCGGGTYAHRYRAESGFLNRSVYCNDLTYIIRHIHQRMAIFRFQDF